MDILIKVGNCWSISQWMAINDYRILPKHFNKPYLDVEKYRFAICFTHRKNSALVKSKYEKTNFSEDLLTIK